MVSRVKNAGGTFPMMRGLMAALSVLVALMAAPCAAQAQIVMIVNGAPITNLEIEQRLKLEQVLTNKTPSREQVVKDLIDDRLKVSVAKRYSFELADSDVDDAYTNMGRRVRMTPDQLGQMLASRGTSGNAFKAKIRADLTWQQLVRGRFQSSLQIGEADVNNALQARGSAENNDVSFVYTLYPVVVVIPAGSPEALLDGKRREAENLRSRFLNCADGLKLARALRDVAVREPITRASADLSPQLRELLDKLEMGRLTTVEATPQGLQMFALCDKKQAGAGESATKRELRDELFAKKFEAEGTKWLKELRAQAMIERR